MNVVAAVVIVVGLLANLLVAPTLCWLKGRKLWATVGIFVGPLHWIPALSLARPDSWWASRYYDESKLQRAREREQERLDDSSIDPATGLPVPSEILSITEDEIANEDPITQRAWAKARSEQLRLVRESGG